MNRRGFLQGLFAAPAIVSVSSLMPILVIPEPPALVLQFPFDNRTMRQWMDVTSIRDRNGLLRDYLLPGYRKIVPTFRGIPIRLAE